MFTHKEINAIFIVAHTVPPLSDNRLLRFFSLYMPLAVYHWQGKGILASVLCELGRFSRRYASKSEVSDAAEGNNTSEPLRSGHFFLEEHPRQQDGQQPKHRRCDGCVLRICQGSRRYDAQ